MSENMTDKKRCGVCHQGFDSDQELQQHHKSAHPQNRAGDTHPGSNHPTNAEMQKKQEKQEKLAS